MTTTKDTTSDTIRIHSPRSTGFSILYHDASLILLKQHETVIKTYLALMAHANGNRSAHPSLDTIAKVVGVDRRTIMRANEKLENLGLLRIVRPETNGRGRANDYWLTTPEFYAKIGDIESVRIGDSPIDIGDKSDPNLTVKGDSRMSLQQEVQEQEERNNYLPPRNSPTRARAHAREDDGVPADWQEEEEEEEERTIGPTVRSQSQPRTQPQQRTGPTVSHTENNGVQSSEQWTPQYEMKHPYWTKLRQEAFRTFGKQYPKPGNKWEAAREWRLAFAEKDLLIVEDGEKRATTLYQSLFDGLFAWHNYWQEQGTPEQYIPLFANWIAKRRWQETPGVRR